jgi:hypothetical protein
VHAALGSSDDGAVALHHHRSLHEPRSGEQELDDCLGRPVFGRVEPELREQRVLADEILDRVFQRRDDALERRPVGRRLQVLDDVGVDTEVPRDREGVRRRASARVVVDRDLRHGGIVVGWR